MSYEIWNIISKIAFGISAICVGVMIYLFVHDDILSVVGILSGRRAYRAVQRMKLEKRRESMIENSEEEEETKLLVEDKDKLTTVLRFILICGLLFMISTRNVMAQDDTENDDNSSANYAEEQEIYPQSEFTVSQNCVVRIQIFLVQDNEEILLREGRGILIGSEEINSTNIITSRSLVAVNEDDIQSGDETERADSRIYILIGRDIRIPVTIEQTSAEMDLAILSLGQSIYDKQTAIFCDKSIIEDVIDEVTILYDTDGAAVKRKVTAIYQDSGINWMQYDGETIPGGCAVIGKNGELVAMTVEQSGRYNTAICIGDVASVLRSLGISYREKEEEYVVVDMTALKTVVDMLEITGEESYTEESLAAYTEALNNAHIILEKTDTSQEEVDEAYSRLVSAKNSLVRVERISPIIVVIMVIISLIIVTMAIVAVFYFLRRKKIKQEERRKKEIESKKAPMEYQPFIPSYIGRIETEKEHRKNIDNEMTGFAPSRDQLILNSEDTTVLSSEIKSEEMPTTVLNQNTEIAKAYLFYSNRDDEIALPNKESVVGKGKNANIRIENSAVSREHIRIGYADSKWYVTDLNTTNGTYIDDQKLKSDQKYELLDGMKLRLADEEFVFRISKGRK